MVKLKCKNCKWWGKYEGGVCDYLSGVRLAEDAGQDKAVIVATASDDQGLDADFVTGPDFGCIHCTPIDKK